MKMQLLYDGKYYFEQLVKSVTWSGDVSQPYRTLSISMINTLHKEETIMKFELGKEVRFYVDNVGLFRGIIFAYDINSDGDATLTVYDENIYLTKNTDTRKFAKMTAASIVKEICKAFGIPVGTIANTGYVIPRMLLRNMTLWDMVVTALTETRKQNNRKFFVSTKGGKLYLTEKKDTLVRWMLEDGVNILTASRNRSIEEMRTSVKVIGGDDKKPVTATVKDTALIAKYGLMQQTESAEYGANKAQAEQQAKARLKELGKVKEDVTVEALGNIELTAGTAVYAFESMTDLVGGFYVNADSHTFEGGSHRMTLTLSKTDDLPKLDYEDDEEKKEAVKTAKKKAKKKTTKKSTGKKRRTIKDVDADIAQLSEQLSAIKNAKGGGK